MKKVIWTILVLSGALSQEATAQTLATSTNSCADHLNTSPQPQVGALLNCLAEMQRAIDRLEDQFSDSNPSIDEITALIDDRLAALPPAPWEGDIEAAIASIPQQTTLSPEQIDERIEAKTAGEGTGVPEGAVVAFDVPTRCPRGWTLFEEGTSRTIVGAYFDRGAGSTRVATEDQNGDKLQARHYRDTGGEEEHELEIPEIPRHSHDYSYSKTSILSDSGADNSYVVDGDWSLFIHSESGRTASSGGLRDGSTEPHNNMPPYIALYFCKKEA